MRVTRVGSISYRSANSSTASIFPRNSLRASSHEAMRLAMFPRMTCRGRVQRVCGSCQCSKHECQCSEPATVRALTMFMACEMNITPVENATSVLLSGS